MKVPTILSALLLVPALLIAGCGSGKSEKAEITEKPAKTAEVKADNDIKSLMQNTIDAVITLTNGKTINIELYPDIAPKTTANFIDLANRGFYEGTIFHRAIEGFVVQGGGYDAQYNLKSVSETVEGEFSENGIKNDLHHDRGVISMARVPSEADSASSQFFIVQQDAEYLDGQYAAFGKVTAGMEVVDEIAKSPKMQNPPPGMKDVPAEIYEIESVYIINGMED